MTIKDEDWNYIKTGIYPNDGEEVLAVISDDEGSFRVLVAFHEELNNIHFWEIYTNSASIHSGSESVCSNVICWMKKPDLPEALKG